MSAPRAKKRIAPNPLLDDRKVEQIPIEALQPPERNARTHSQRQVRQIARSINRFGFINPVLVDRNNRIIAGVRRVAGARLAGHTTVPTIRIEHLSDEEKRAYVIADNRLAEKAGWDRDILAIELKGLIDLHFDVEFTGFEIPEIEMLFDAVDPAANNPEDDLVPDLAPDRVVTKAGDLWKLGDHLLLCADAVRRDSFAALMSGTTAQLAFVDPPFNVRIRGHVSGKGRVKHREFAQASGEKTSAQFAKFLEELFGSAGRTLDGRRNPFRLFGLATS